MENTRLATTESTRLSTKGQLILPKAIRDSKAWEPGTEFVVEECGDGVFLRPIGRFPAVDLDEVAGCLRSKVDGAKTVDEMHDAIGREVMRRHGRNRY
jgi:AbrB family looped-hinge helix DNA binding protein